MRLAEAIDRLPELDDDHMLFAEQPWTLESAALIDRLCPDGRVPPEIKARGFDYFFEVDTAREGYFWYHKTHEIAGRRVAVSFASGNGGNKLYLVPSRELVVAITSRAYGRAYGQRRSEDILKALL